MPDAYEIQDGRYVQYRYAVGVVNGLIALLPAVPANKVWTFTAAMVLSDIAETQDYWFSILGKDTAYYPITAPVEATVNAAISRYFPMLREGMEIKLFPSEQLVGFRDAAAVGSTLLIYGRFVETDLPLYDYVEPQLALRQKRAVSSVRSRMGSVGTIGGSIVGIGGHGIPGIGGGGGGTPPPV